MRQIDLIVIHCSATQADRNYSVKQLASDHCKRGFKGIGYHYYITIDGTIYDTRALERVGAHVKGFNKTSIGICYEGGLDCKGNPADTRTDKQRVSLRLLIDRLLKQFGKDMRICGHRDLSKDLNGDGYIESNEWSKLCPCFDVEREYL